VPLPAAARAARNKQPSLMEGPEATTMKLSRPTPLIRFGARHERRAQIAGLPRAGRWPLANEHHAHFRASAIQPFLIGMGTRRDAGRLMPLPDIQPFGQR
jgi:hypothetical protein